MCVTNHPRAKWLEVIVSLLVIQKASSWDGSSLRTGCGHVSWDSQGPLPRAEARAAACAAVAGSAARGKAQSSAHRALSASEPCLLMSCWPKQGRGPSPESVEQPWPSPVTCRETHACPPVAVGCVNLGSGGESSAAVTMAFTSLQLAGWPLGSFGDGQEPGIAPGCCTPPPQMPSSPGTGLSWRSSP